MISTMFHWKNLFVIVTLLGLCCGQPSNSTTILEILRDWIPDPARINPTSGIPPGMEPMQYPTVNERDGVILQPFVVTHCCKPGANPRHPAIYCYQGTNKEASKLWMTVEVYVSINPEEYDLYWGANKTEIMYNYANDYLFLRLNYFPTFLKTKNLVLDPFACTCLGIVTDKNYHLELRPNRLNYQLQAQFVLGMILLLSAKRLAKSWLFHYLIGTVAGIILSVVLVLYIFISFLPLKKTTAIGLFVGGGSILAYLMNWIWNSFSYILYQHVDIIKWYILVSGVVSFMVTYKYGTPTNPRTITVIQWAYQIIGVAVMCLSTHNKPAMLVVIGVATFLFYVPVFQSILRFFWLFVTLCFRHIMFVNYWILSTIWGILTRFLRRNVNQIRPGSTPFQGSLTLEQYRIQGRVETEKALLNLKNTLLDDSFDFEDMMDRLSLEGQNRVMQFLETSKHLNAEEEIQRGIQEDYYAYGSRGFEISEDED